jgi:hypothetical protein
MKREKLNTNVLPETKRKLQQIARREKLLDRGNPSKGRAIDYLVERDTAGASKAGEA